MIKIWLRKILVYIFGKFNIKLYTLLPIGIDPFSDIKWRLKNYKFNIIFDIGANYGDFCNSVRSKDKECKLYVFEPLIDCYLHLKEVLKNDKNAFIFQLAIGKFENQGYMKIAKDRDLSKLYYDINQNDKVSDFQEVKIVRLDTFVNEKKIKNIDYLKIDAEGLDLDILYSAEDLLKNRRIDFIQVELGFNSLNTDHVSFNEATAFLEKYNYFPFGIYEQKHDWKNKIPVLRRCDCVFISPELFNSKSF